MADTLFNRMGGKLALTAAIEIFYQRIQNDPIISSFFEGLDMKQQKTKLYAFLSMVLGGETPYTGKDMRAAHAHLNIQESHFNAVIGHLEMALEALDIEKKLIDEIVDIALKMKSDILYYDASLDKKKQKNETDNRYRQVLEQAFDAVIMVDTNKNISFANPAVEKMLGYSQEELLGKSLKIVLPLNVESNDNATSMEMELTKKDGSKVWGNLFLSSVKVTDGEEFAVCIKDITQQRNKVLEMEQVQRELTARMAQVDTACIVSESDLKGNIIFVNDKLCEVSQYTRAEMIGQPHSMFRHSDMSKEVFKELWATIGRGNIFRGLIKNKKKDGNPYWVDAIIAPVLGPNGKPVKYLGLRYEITESVQEQIRAKGILDAVNESYAFVEFDTKGNILDANDNLCGILGYNKGDLKGKHHRIFVESTYANSNQYQKFWMDLENGIAQKGEFKCITSTGQDIWIQAVYAPVKDDMGRIVKVVQMATDITAQKRANLNMEGLQATVDTSFARIEFDKTGLILDANQNFAITLGYNSPKDIIGHHHSIFVDRAYKTSKEYEHFWRDLASGITQNGEFNRIGKQGQDVWIQAAYTPVKNERGEVVKVIKIATNITDQKALLIGINKVIAQAGTEGNLAARLDGTNATGDSKALADSVNLLLDAISNPVMEINRVVEHLAKGNLTERFSLDTKGDFKKLGDGFNLAVQNMSVLLSQISQIGSLVAASAEEMLAKGEEMKKTTQEVASATQQMAEGAQQQAQQTDDASKLIEDVLKSANEMAKKAELIKKAAEQGQKNSTDGLTTIKLVVDNMGDIQKSASSTSNSIAILSERSEEIANALSVITDIAAQTNLLALNAAIEAARAGDAGRGFAVVAEEIRKLAEGSRKSAIDIEKVIKEVHKDISAAAKAIGAMESSVKSGTNASKEAEDVFAHIEKASNDTFDLSKEIVDATDQQKGAINTTAKNIEKIVVVAEETASGTEQIASSGKSMSQGMNEVTATSEDLANVANQLQESISKFKLN